MARTCVRRSLTSRAHPAMQSAETIAVTRTGIQRAFADLPTLDSAISCAALRSCLHKIQTDPGSGARRRNGTGYESSGPSALCKSNADEFVEARPAQLVQSGGRQFPPRCDSESVLRRRGAWHMPCTNAIGAWQRCRLRVRSARTQRRRAMTRIHSKLATCWIAVAALALLAAPAYAGQPEDAWITTKVRARLIRHPGIAPFAINVDTQDGVVTLFGSISAEVDKREAGRQAMMVSGVKHVQNELQVVSQLAEKQVEKSDGADPRLAGEASRRARRTRRRRHRRRGRQRRRAAHRKRRSIRGSDDGAVARAHHPGRAVGGRRSASDPGELKLASRGSRRAQP